VDHSLIGFNGHVLGVAVDLEEQDVSWLHFLHVNSREVFVEHGEQRGRMRAMGIVPFILIPFPDHLLEGAPDQSGAVAAHAFLKALVAETRAQPRTGLDYNFIAQFTHNQSLPARLIGDTLRAG
jgi:hypothetical protein